MAPSTTSAKAPGAALPPHSMNPKQVAKHVSFGAQLNALVRKTATNQSRQTKTNLCIISLSVVIVLLLFLIQALVDTIIVKTDEVLQPRPESAPFIYTTENRNGCPATVAGNGGTKFFVVDDTPTGDDSIGAFDSTTSSSSVLGSITTNPEWSSMQSGVFPERGWTYSDCKNTERPLPGSAVNITEYSSTSSIEDELYNTADQFLGEDAYMGGAIYKRVNLASKTFKLEVALNHTLTLSRDFGPLAEVFTSGIVTLLSGPLTTFSGYQDFPQSPSDGFDIVSLLGGFMFVFLFLLTMPTMMSTLVYEKEHKIKSLQVMMGMRESAYSLSFYIFFFCLYMVSFLCTWGLSALFSFRMFTVNNPALIFIMFFCWGHVLVAFAFFLSTFFNTSKAATVSGYLIVFLGGLIASNLLTSTLYNIENSAGTKFAAVFYFPPFTLFWALSILSRMVSFDGNGLQFDEVTQAGVELDVCLGAMAFQWAVLISLTWYLNQVWPSSFGVKRHPLFLFQRSYWSSESVVVAESVVLEAVEGDPEDIQQLRTDIRTGVHNTETHSILTYDLSKTYPAPFAGIPDKVAVKPLCMSVRKGGCLGFLGSNGAGKSTTVNMLAGLFAPTSGTAKVNGFDIRTEMESIHADLGVCPQHDVLWQSLTAGEHLRFYGRLKGLSGKQLEDDIEASLRGVNLHNESAKRSGEFSGGMRRRLSVAISFMSSPSVVLLDEPSTGLDPHSARDLWEVISAQRENHGCTVLLVSHNLEEVTALATDCAIFFEGRLQCVGSPAELKSRFGMGYELAIAHKIEDYATMEALVKGAFADAVVVNSLGGTTNWEVPTSSVVLADAFQMLGKARDEDTIQDFALSNTSLEGVFLSVVENAEKKLAAEKAKDSETV